MPLPSELEEVQKLITSFQSIDEVLEKTGYDVNPGRNRWRRGTSSIVYKIKDPSPERSREYLACKKIDLIEGWTKKVAKTEIELLDKFLPWYVPFIRQIFYVEEGEVRELYIVLEPWVEVGFDHFLDKIQIQDPQEIAKLASWYNPDDHHIWPHFLLHCLAFLASMWMLDPPDPEFEDKLMHMQVEDAYIKVPKEKKELFKRVRHKDLKPGNILLNWLGDDEGLAPIIIDFGISKLHNDGDESTHSGTDRYKAPEQKPGQPPSTKSDVFSLGCCFVFIEAILHSGGHGVREIFKILNADPQRKNFHQHINEVNTFLHTPTAQGQIFSHSIVGFRKGLRNLVETRMLVHDVTKRDDAGRVFLDFSGIYHKYTELRQMEPDSEHVKWQELHKESIGRRRSEGAETDEVEWVEREEPHEEAVRKRHSEGAETDEYDEVEWQELYEEAIRRRRSEEAGTDSGQWNGQWNGR